MSIPVKNKNKIIIKGARQHNLKNINVSIPRNTLTVIPGLSGSGKTAISKPLNGISVGKFESLLGQKGQYFFGGNEVLFSLPGE